MSPDPLSLFLPDEAATARLGDLIAPRLAAGDIIALWGSLGSGKTALARAIIRARTHPDEEVPSPTFTLVQTYDPPAPAPGPGPRPGGGAGAQEGSGPALWHFDLYRLEDPEEALALDIDEAFAHAICLIEWPERLGPFLPADRLDLRLGMGQTPAGPAGRRATLVPRGRWTTDPRKAALPALLTEAFPCPEGPAAPPTAPPTPIP